MPAPNLTGRQVRHSNVAKHRKELASCRFGALPSEFPAIVNRTDKQGADDVMGTVAVVPPSGFLDLGLAVLQPVINRLGDGQIVALDGELASDGAGEPGLNNGNSGYKDAGPVPLS
jgi:hypothetical protein